MADGTNIEWTDATWNVVNGCSVTSPGCKHCYAMKQAHRVEARRGLTEKTAGGMVWTGEVRFNEKVLEQPLRWRKPRRIFVCAHGDLFHESVPDEWIDRVFAVMALCAQHQFQVLTKRSARMREYLAQLDDFALQETPEYSAAEYRVQCDDDPNGSAAWHAQTARLESAIETVSETLGEGKPLPNVWLGVSVEDQQRADERIPDLLATPAAVRFLSCEPLLGPVDLRWIAEPDEDKDGVIDALLGCNWIEDERGAVITAARPGHVGRSIGRRVCSSSKEICENRKLDWVIVGGESGPKARPMHPDWARSLRDQCEAASVPFLFKQWGEWHPMGQTLGDGTFNAMDKGEKPGLWHEPSMSVRVGKKRAGRLLDGVQHDGFPATPMTAGRSNT